MLDLVHRLNDIDVVSKKQNLILKKKLIKNNQLTLLKRANSLTKHIGVFSLVFAKIISFVKD